ncbi:Endothiapepsin [Beauveria bassiana D1-5]|uniref:Endothiapepsin n=1 Tax=Beauveria bassiana D1-5 TaxID=1245745 RepID=A0A0A2VQH5_BEABA|nr:Endothiapepsin [Beauveria bassiana D1-5]
MQILFLAAMAAAAAAAASSSSTFALNAVPNNSTNVNLVTTYAHLYQKYRIPPPPSLSSALHQRTLAKRSSSSSGCATSGSVTAHPNAFVDGAYLIDVDIGTPPRRFHLNLDTGSSDVWVYGSVIPDKFLSGQTQYDPARSRTAQLLLPPVLWLAGYIDFSFVGGIVYRETVTVLTEEGKGQGRLVVEDQGLQVATVVSESIAQDRGMDGIMGLGFDKLNFAFPTKQKTWFSNIKHRLSAPLFTVDFRHREQGKFTFGYIDEAVGPLTYTPVDASAGYWTWTSPGYAVGNGPFQQRALTGTLDTGTTIMIMPSDVVKAYYAGVPGATYSAAEHGYVFDCGAALPDFTFGVASNATIKVPGSYIEASTAENEPGKCVGALQSGFGDIVVFGAPALQASVAVFDAEGLRIGWANKTLAA